MNFADNESWCASKYPVGQGVDANASAQLKTQYDRCTRSGIFAPWTIAGRIERGLVDDAALKNLVKTIQNIGTPVAVPGRSPPLAPGTTPLKADMVAYGVLGLAGILGAMLVFGGKRGGRRSSRRRRR